MQIYIIFSSTLKTLVEGSLEVKLPTIWTDGKAEVGRVREEKRRREKIRGRWEMKNCTPLWREARFQVKMDNTHTDHAWSTFGSWDVEKVHAVVAQSTFPSQNAQNTMFGALLGVEMSRKCTPLWREAHSEVKMYKTHQLRTTFGSWDVEKVRALAARSTFPSQTCKIHHVQIFFGSWDVAKVRVVRSTFPSEHVKITMLRPLLKVQMWFRVIGARDFAHCQKWAKCGVLCMSKSDGMHGTFAEDLQRCMSRDRRSTRDMFIRDRNVRRSGRWFPERGCILEHQICRFAKMILRDRCGTSYDLASIFRGRRSALHRWSGQIAKRIGTRAVSSALHFLCLKEVSQICFVSDDVVNFKNWGRLAE